MFLLGVAWAMVLSLVLWPLHPFRPARRAVAAAYRVLADFARSLEQVTGTFDSGAPRASTHAHARTTRVCAARSRLRASVLAAVRRPRQGRSPRGEQLLVLIEGAEQLFGTLVAIDAGARSCARERVEARR